MLCQVSGIQMFIKKRRKILPHTWAHSCKEITEILSITKDRPHNYDALGFTNL